ncbi:aspartic peptidase domain-containing protein [Apiospora aurea]|uniref:Aspartic peptidase domain-containing protein n=1 Tax=Apiospora aurea TaxID=335848 RepID=A0ABR1PSM0_9PEZI
MIPLGINRRIKIGWRWRGMLQRCPVSGDISCYQVLLNRGVKGLKLSGQGLLIVTNRTILTDGDKAFLQYSFASVDDKSTIEIDMPLRSYARQQEPEDAEMGWCTMRIYLGSCMLGAPFTTRAFFAANDDRVELTLAKGGVAERGSKINHDQVVDRIPSACAMRFLDYAI